jgi:hypothetical protein
MCKDGETPPGMQVLTHLLRSTLPKYQITVSTRKVFWKIAFVFVKPKEWIVQLKRKSLLGDSFILGIPTETSPSSDFRKVKNKPLMRV